jgi:hypothetical protein
VPVSIPLDENLVVCFRMAHAGGALTAAGNLVPTAGAPFITLLLHTPSLISAVFSGNRPAEVFSIELDDKGYVGLNHDGEKMSIERACEIILSSFLFGDLP